MQASHLTSQMRIWAKNKALYKQKERTKQFCWALSLFLLVKFLLAQKWSCKQWSSCYRTSEVKFALFAKGKADAHRLAIPSLRSLHSRSELHLRSKLHLPVRANLVWRPALSQITVLSSLFCFLLVKFLLAQKWSCKQWSFCYRKSEVAMQWSFC